MDNTDMTIIEKLNSIKYKLNKYSASNNNEKVSVYLNALNNIQNINLNVLKESEIVSCLKALEKKSNPEISQLANDIIANWKEVCKSKNSLSKSNVKNEPASQSKNINSSSMSGNTTNLKNRRADDNEAPGSPKKQKLSFTDYRAKGSSLENNKSKEEKTSLLNDFKYEPTTKPKNASMSQIVVPKPTVPLSNIISLSENSKSFNRPTFSTSYISMPEIQTKTHANTIEEDNFALENIMKNKKSKHVIYTGRKNVINGAQNVPKLYELSVRALVNSLDELPNRISIYNTINDFPIAFDLIKPVIERTNAKQLQSIEYYSPNLMEDTDYIWKKIFEQEFKKMGIDQKESDETWRDFYFKKIDERQKKFDDVRNRISQTQANKPKERSTQMATVKFVSSTSRHSSSTISSQSSAAAKIKSSSNGVPVRQILREPSGFKRCSNAIEPKRPSFNPPVQSKGMKAAAKLLKTFRR